MYSVIAKLVNLFKKPKPKSYFDFQIEDNQIYDLKYKNILIFSNIHFQIQQVINNSFELIKPNWKIVQNPNKIFLIFSFQNNKQEIHGSIILTFNQNHLIIEKRINSDSKTQLQFFNILDFKDSEIQINKDKQEIVIKENVLKIESTEFWNLEDKKLILKPTKHFGKQTNSQDYFIVKSNNKAYFTTKITFRSSNEEK